jgi:hypothetical protein
LSSFWATAPDGVPTPHLAAGAGTPMFFTPLG